jgi:D-sedoheptulose 7-phosphate isomerase
MKATDKVPVSTTSMLQHLETYKENLGRALGMATMSELPKLGEALRDAWRLGHTVYLCGNGGSAGNAIHLANDFLFGAGLRNGGGLRVEALNANPAVLTCLAKVRLAEEAYTELCAGNVSTLGEMLHDA